MSADKALRLRRQRDRAAISMEELPEEFVTALKEPYYNAEQASLDHLIDGCDLELAEHT